MQTMKIKLIDKKLSENNEIAYLTFKVSENFDFKAWQFVMLDNWNLKRAYSIASSPSLLKEWKICFYVKKASENGMSAYLVDKIKIQDELDMMWPFWHMFIKEQSEEKIYLLISAWSWLWPILWIYEDLIQSWKYKNIYNFYQERYFENIVKNNENTNIENEWKLENRCKENLKAFVPNIDEMNFTVVQGTDSMELGDVIKGNVIKGNVMINMTNDIENENTSESDNEHQINNNGIENLLNSLEPVTIRPTEEQIQNACEDIPFGSIHNPTNISCPINLTSFTGESMVTQIIFCGHCYVPSALRTWFNSNVRCPLCRYDIRIYNPLTVINNPYRRQNNYQSSENISQINTIHPQNTELLVETDNSDSEWCYLCLIYIISNESF